MVQLSVGSTSGDVAAKQTREYIKVHFGPAATAQIAAVLGEPQTNTIRRVGAFDDGNGLFFQLDGSTLSIVRRTSTSGSVVENVVNQDNWNLDKMNGTGPSGVTIDPTKLSIYVVDFQWFGAGRIRWGIFIDGHIVYCHQDTRGNVDTVPFTGQPSVPLRIEITNSGTTSSPASCSFTGGIVTLEGGRKPNGNYASGDTGNVTKSFSDTALVPILTIRNKASHIRSTIVPITWDVLHTGNTTAYYALIFNASLTGASWVSTSVAAEKDVSATSLTGGLIVSSGYIDRRSTISLTNTNVSSGIAADIEGVPDTLTIAMQSLSGMSDGVASLSWEELV